MSHAITTGDVLLVFGIIAGIVVALGVLFLAIALMNPFRSGH